MPTQRWYTMSLRPSALWTVASTGQTYSQGASSQCMHGTGWKWNSVGASAGPEL